MKKTVNDIEKIIIAQYKNIELFQKASNYISFWNNDNMRKSHNNAVECPELLQFQYSYKDKKWYQYREEGSSDSPKEIFIRWIE